MNINLFGIKTSPAARALFSHDWHNQRACLLFFIAKVHFQRLYQIAVLLLACVGLARKTLRLMTITTAAGWWSGLPSSADDRHVNDTLSAWGIAGKGMSKTRMMLLSGCVLLLAGCAGTRSDFSCDASTSDTCMTMEQANEKAKLREDKTVVKRDVGGLPRLADGPFREAAVVPLKPKSVIAVKKTTPSRVTQVKGEHRLSPAPIAAAVPVASLVAGGREASSPARTVERLGRLWIAPYIDSEDVYHQPGRVEFVITPPCWGALRVR